MLVFKGDKSCFSGDTDGIQVDQDRVCVADLTTMIVIGEIIYNQEGTGNKEHFKS